MSIVPADESARQPIRARLSSPASIEVPALVASSQAIHPGRRNGREATARRSLIEDWQRQALEYYDLLGECWYPAQFYGRMLARVRLYAGIRQPDGEVEESKDPKAQEILARIQDPGGGQSQWMAAFGRLQFLIGDGYLTATVENGEETWEYLSPAELVVTDRKFKRVGPTGAGGGQEYEDAGENLDLVEGEMRVWRLWRRHPRHSRLADSPIRAVLDQYEYLMLLGKAARAQALSRIAGSGLLVVDDKITIPPPDAEADDANTEDDPFMRLLTDYITKPIGEPGSAAAVAPIVARIDVGENRRIDDLIKLIQIHDPNQTADWQERIEKTLTRIAVGLDMPPEEFLGLAQANHWTGWVITDQKWQAHGEGVAIQLCNDLTSAYYRPACIEEGVADAEKLVAWYDAAEVVTHPDRGKDAQMVHDRGSLSDEALREAHNFSEHDAPSAEERATWFAIKTRNRIRPPDAPEEPVSDTGSDAPGSEPGGNGDGPRTDSPSPMNDGQARIQGAAELALERARELAGSRLGARKMQCDGCFRGTDNVIKSELCATVGQEIVRMVGIESEFALVSGACDPFIATVIRWGVDEARAREMASMIERYAADTLYDEAPSLPATFATSL